MLEIKEEVKKCGPKFSDEREAAVRLLCLSSMRGCD